MRKIRLPFFSCQSLLLGTNVPNDNGLSVIYDYMMTHRSFSGCGSAGADNLSSFWFLIQPTNSN